ncbi:MAG: TonB family protein [Chitinophagales bacterium]
MTSKNTLFQTIITLIFYCNAFAVTQPNNTDQSLSPYFHIEGERPNTETFPLQSTHVEANIAGVIADVCVRQTYKNEGETPIEAIYVFPASTRAAVHALTMKIGERTITAEIQERNKARQNYEKAKRAGKRATLLQQERPNVFQMRVANILPNDVIEVELSYTELLIPEDGTYEFIYPTVVGPRYSSEQADLLASSNQNWVSNPHLKEGAKSASELFLQVNLSTGIPLQKIQSDTHQVSIDFEAKDKASVVLNESEKFGGNRDFVLQYQLKGKQIETGLMLYEGTEENYFLMMMQPPKRIEGQQIAPREYVFIVDVSGSMYGFPLDISKTLMRDLLGNLQPQDRFNVLLFAGRSALFSKESVAANAKNLDTAIKWIDGQHGGGGTEVLQALQTAFDIPKTQGYSRSFVIATDGYVSVEPEAFDLIRSRLSDANVFPFGIGSSVNRHLIEGMAYSGQGEPFVIQEADKAASQASKFRQYISEPLLTNIQLKFNGFEAYDVSQKSFPDLMASRPIVVFGKYKGAAKGTIEVTANRGNKQFTYQIEASSKNVQSEHKALPYLWARDKIRLLEDFKVFGYSDKIVEDVTQLGLKYHLLTPYTSFVAIDQEVVNPSKGLQSIQQPQPLPQGVSEKAIGRRNDHKNFPSAKLTVPPPPPPSSMPEGLEIVEDEEVLEDETEILEVEMEILNYEEIVTEEEPEIYSIVEVMPEFVGGQNAMFAFIAKHLQYPKTAKGKGIEGTVYVGFDIEADGSITNIHIKRGIENGEDLEVEAMRVIGLMPNWKPGMQRGKAVKVAFTLPIRFSCLH